MTAQEKAEELVGKYRMILYLSDTDAGHEILCTGIAKKCALIAVDEILNDDWYIATHEHLIERKEYWQQVKKEIEKL